MCCHTCTRGFTMPHTQGMAPKSVTVGLYIHCGANLSLCYPLLWNITLEYTKSTHFNVLGQTFHTHQRNLTICYWYDDSQSEAQKKVFRTSRVLKPGPVVCESITLSARESPTAAWQNTMNTINKWITDFGDFFSRIFKAKWMNIKYQSDFIMGKAIRTWTVLVIIALEYLLQTGVADIAESKVTSFWNSHLSK